MATDGSTTIQDTCAEVKVLRISEGEDVVVHTHKNATWRIYEGTYTVTTKEDGKVRVYTYPAASHRLEIEK